jgi:Asp-tRNA(Asn)/Glu-tRNA(Gln) amidotransferase A subunit family amidase
MDIPASELASLIRSRRVKPSEAIDACFERIHGLNPILNAFVALDEERAKKRANEMDEMQARGEELGPLGGVPLGVKDLEDVEVGCLHDA